MARILVVDDEPDMLLVVRMVLDRAGYSTVLAADGEQALERLGGVDLVLLDVGMPVMDGWSVLAAARARALPVRVVVVSGRRAPGDVRRAFDLGAVDYLRKPFPPDRLLVTVAGALERTVEEQEAHRAATLAAEAAP